VSTLALMEDTLLLVVTVPLLFTMWQLRKEWRKLCEYTMYVFS
jgi:hypothetical protein